MDPWEAADVSQPPASCCQCCSTPSFLNPGDTKHNAPGPWLLLFGPLAVETNNHPLTSSPPPFLWLVTPSLACQLTLTPPPLSNWSTLAKLWLCWSLATIFWTTPLCTELSSTHPLSTPSTDTTLIWKPNCCTPDLMAALLVFLCCSTEEKRDLPSFLNSISTFPSTALVLTTTA